MSKKYLLTTPVVTGSYINKEIYDCLNEISNCVGEKITEYHWFKLCKLMKTMEDLKMVEVIWRKL